MPLVHLSGCGESPLRDPLYLENPTQESPSLISSGFFDLDVAQIQDTMISHNL